MTDGFQQLSRSPFSPSASRHRLPTLSASQALNAQQCERPKLSTGSKLLDILLTDSLNSGNLPPRISRGRLVNSLNLVEVGKACGRDVGGIAKGKLTEVCGPPGSGKTAFAVHVVANALLAGEKVTWIETAQPLPLERLIHVLRHNGDKDPLATLCSIRIIKCPSLAHLLAIILHPPSAMAAYPFPEKDTAVLVVDNISTLFSVAFPPGIDGNYADKKNGGSGVKGWVPPSVRRFSIMTDLSIGLGKLAVMRNIVVLILNQLSTRIIRGVGAILQPAVASPSWSNAFTNRLLIFRHDTPRAKLRYPEIESSVRYVSILKASGVSYDNEDGPIVPITVGKNGTGDVEFVHNVDATGSSGVWLQTSQSNPSVSIPGTQLAPQTTPLKARQSTLTISPPTQPLSVLLMSPLKSQGKRKREVAESEDEDGNEYYAWGDELDLIQQFEQEVAVEGESLGHFEDSDAGLYEGDAGLNEVG